MLSLWEMICIAAALTLCVFMGVTLALIVVFCPASADRRASDHETPAPPPPRPRVDVVG